MQQRDATRGETATATRDATAAQTTTIRRVPRAGWNGDTAELTLRLDERPSWHQVALRLLTTHERGHDLRLSPSGMDRLCAAWAALRADLLGETPAEDTALTVAEPLAVSALAPVPALALAAASVRS